MKPLSAKWFVQLLDYLKAHPEIIKNDYKGAGITAEHLVNELQIAHSLLHLLASANASH